MTFQTSALILSWVAILLLALVVSGLIRQVHALAAGPRRVGPRPGAPAAEPVGSRAALRDLLARAGVTSGALR
jgi:hypothetical protein